MQKVGRIGNRTGRAGRGRIRIYCQEFGTVHLAMAEFCPFGGNKNNLRGARGRWLAMGVFIIRWTKNGSSTPLYLPKSIPLLIDHRSLKSPLIYFCLAIYWGAYHILMASWSWIMCLIHVCRDSFHGECLVFILRMRRNLSGKLLDGIFLPWGGREQDAHGKLQFIMIIVACSGIYA
ncbi:hypothetical protein DFH27DRAFT_289611 [Peziza echinospora]|nr:hypothetical protein DFH27DRAFT_289611 [Peziza echinospora]